MTSSKQDSEKTITGIAKAWHDIGVLIKIFIERGRIYMHAWMRLLDDTHAFRRGYECHKSNVLIRNAMLA